MQGSGPVAPLQNVGLRRLRRISREEYFPWHMDFVRGGVTVPPRK